MLAYGIAVAVVALSCGWTAYNLRRVRQLSQELVESTTRDSQVWDRMVSSLERQDRSTLRLLVQSSSDSVRAFADNSMTFRAALQQALQEPGDLEPLQRIRRDYARYLAAFAQLQENPDSAAAYYNTSVLPLFLTIRRELLRLQELYLDQLVQRSEQVRGEARWAQATMTFSAAFFIVLGAVFLNRLHRHLGVLEAQRAAAFESERLARETAELANSAKTRFLATVTHELRTPLTGILGSLDLLEAEERTPRQREFLTAIRSSSGVLLHLVNDLLDLARMEEGKLSLARRPFHLEELVGQVEAIMAPVAGAKSLSLGTVLGSDGPTWLQGDPDRLRQVLLNLTNNAIKFTDSGSVQLAVTLLETPDEGFEKVRFEVVDTGIGIPDSELNSIFEPFHQVGAFDRRSQSGAGLGLAIVSSLVQRMGGDIQVSSRLGHGTRFWFELGLEVGAPLDDAGQAPVAGGVPGATILLAEDNPLSRRIISLQLQSLGYRVETAGNGAEALELLEHHPVDLVLMDCQMPLLDGYEATRRLRRLSDPHKSRVRVLALTAHAIEGEFEKCLAAGMDDCLMKPVSVAELGKTVARWLLRGGAVDGPRTP